MSEFIGVAFLTIFLIKVMIRLHKKLPATRDRLMFEAIILMVGADLAPINTTAVALFMALAVSIEAIRKGGEVE